MTVSPSPFPPVEEEHSVFQEPALLLLVESGSDQVVLGYRLLELELMHTVNGGSLFLVLPRFFQNLITKPNLKLEKHGGGGEGRREEEPESSRSGDRSHSR